MNNSQIVVFAYSIYFTALTLTTKILEKKKKNRVTLSLVNKPSCAHRESFKLYITKVCKLRIGILDDTTSVEVYWCSPRALLLKTVKTCKNNTSTLCHRNCVLRDMASSFIYFFSSPSEQISQMWLKSVRWNVLSATV